MRVARGRKLRVGLALGAGATHGWAHIGVIRRLEEAGVAPDIICGCSAGALVGAYHAAGKLDILEDWVHNLTVRRTFDYMRMRKGRSLFGEKLLREMSEHFRRLDIEELPFAFAAVATDLQTGREITVKTGSLARAVAASGAFPLLFPPVRIENRWTVDGCLVNPVPVSTCRALGADLVIAVRVLDFGEKSRVTSEARTEAEQWSELLVAGKEGAFVGGAEAPAPQSDRSWSESRWTRVTSAIQRSLPRLRRSERSARRVPGTVSVMLRSAAVHWRLRRSRVVSERADIMIEPRLGRLVLGTDGALRAIAAGRSAAAEVLDRLLPDLQTEQERSAEAGVGSVGHAHGVPPLDSPAAVITSRAVRSPRRTQPATAGTVSRTSAPAPAWAADRVSREQCLIRSVS